MRRILLLTFLLLIGGIIIAAEAKIPSDVESLASAKLITLEPNDVITVSMNKPAGSEYKPGEKISFTVKLKKEGYLYIFDMPQYGNVTQIFPNYYQKENFFRPGTYKIPSVSSYTLTVSGTRSGIELVEFVLSSRPLELGGALSEKNPFLQFETVQKEGFVKFKEAFVKSIIISPEKWTAWTYFYLNAGVNTILNVQTIPSGAQVILDGKYSGNSPVSFNVAPGYHNLSILMNGYQPWNGEIYVGIGEEKNINIPLVPIQQQVNGTLSISVNPSSANVYVDGQFVGSGNQNITLSSGYHSVSVTLNGYESYYNPMVLINPNRTTYLNVNLVPLVGNLYVYSQPYVQIYVDGVYAGGTGYLGYAYITGIPVGYHELKFSKEWYISQTMNYNLISGDNFLSVNLSQAGMLMVNSNVYPIDVRIDGKSYGRIESPNKGVFVPVGSHEVEISNPQYMPYRSTMTFNFQQTTTLNASLTLKPLEISLKAQPNPFSPNGDWFEDTTNFYVNLSRNGYVQISVYSGNVLVWYKNYDAPYGVSSVTWDGKSLDGQTLPDGVYKVVATVESYGQTMTAQTNVVIEKSHYTFLKEIVIIGGILIIIGFLLTILK
ncbi:MAG: PEGA domain-containing protein [Athalassotoga sp.]|uniref:PEGA domain-containing protein n=1 Tax=Athalassotoga sp. TaxID=2022597 RepID=UPI003CFDF33E